MNRSGMALVAARFAAIVQRDLRYRTEDELANRIEPDDLRKQHRHEASPHDLREMAARGHESERPIRRVERGAARRRCARARRYRATRPRRAATGRRSASTRDSWRRRCPCSYLGRRPGCECARRRPAGTPDRSGSARRPGGGRDRSRTSSRGRTSSRNHFAARFPAMSSEGEFVMRRASSSGRMVPIRRAAPFVRQRKDRRENQTRPDRPSHRRSRPALRRRCPRRRISACRRRREIRSS